MFASALMSRRHATPAALLLLLLLLYERDVAGFDAMIRQPD